MLWAEAFCHRCEVVGAVKACCSKVQERRLGWWAHWSVEMRRPGSAHIGMRPEGRTDAGAVQYNMVGFEVGERSSRVV